MEDSRDKISSDQFPFKSHPSRREFLKLSALGVLTFVGNPARASQLVEFDPQPRSLGRGNGIPGRIVICHDPPMGGHNPTIDKHRVEASVHQSISFLTQIHDDIGAAFESLFPGVHAASTFAIKVNCIGPTSTRWEVARAVVSGLSQMLGGTYNVSQVTVFDRNNLGIHGYDESEFTFNGNHPLLSSTNNANNSGYYVWGSEPNGYELSRYLLNSDYVIDIPALKSHTNGNNQITVAMKNHYGSCEPSDLCGNIPGMLTLNSDPNVKDKTGLVITDGLRGTFHGGPGEPPQYWSNYPEGTPNTVLVTTDPVTNEYWAREIINAQRSASGYSPRPCPWIEQASQTPYEIGVSDPELMTVINYDTTAVDEGPEAFSQGTFLGPNAPNPFSESTTLRFRLEESAWARIDIVDASGRVVRRLTSRSFGEGYNQMRWDGRDLRGGKVSAGVYFARLEVGKVIRSRRIVVAR
jgi:hypothetical protein